MINVKSSRRTKRRIL